MMPIDAATALDVLAAGFAVVPPREDGSKRPDGTWRQYEQTPPEAETVARWYKGPRAGIGAVCGASSQHLEMLELEGRAVEDGIWPQLKDRLANAGLGDLLARITEGYLEQSPSGGLHLLFRVTEGARGNLKLARRVTADGEVEVLIETRGQGGYTILAPTSGAVHPTGGEWSVLAGSLRTVATISATERDAIYEVCRTFDEIDVPEAPQPDLEVGWETVSTAPVEGWFDAVVQDYNTSTTWPAKLAGWTEHHTRGGITFWTRPGKDPRHGHSATTNGKGTDRLIVFSSSVHPLLEPWDGSGPATSYDRFSYYAITEHAGDRTSAARQLRSEGYGPASTSTVGTYEPVAETDPWPPAQPIPQPEPVPPWPTDILPGWMQRQVENITRAVECPADLPATFGLGALAVSALGSLEVEARPGHTEPTAIYLATVAGVSEGKTPAKENMMRPVEDYEDAAVLAAKAGLANDEFEREILTEAIAGLKKQASLGDVEARHAASKKISELEERERPREGRMMTSDITPERLATMMSRNGDRLSVISDEAGPLNFDRYGDKGRGSNMDLYLKGWSGARHSQDRQKAPSVLLRRPLIVFTVAAQPEAWDKAMADEEFRTRGLGARFMTCRPAQTAWMRTDDLDRDVWDQEADDTYRIRMADLCRRFGSWQRPAIATLSPGARSTYALWAKRITKRTRPGGDLDHELGWTSKLKDTVIRVSGLLHMADGNNYDVAVDAAVMDRACRLGDYWIGHRLHEPGTVSRDAERILGALIGLEEGATAGATTPFVARRELSRKGPKGLRTIEAYTPPVAMLLKLGLVRLVGATADANTQVSVAVRSAVGFVVHPEAESVLRGATRGDTGRQLPGESIESDRPGRSVALVAPVAISGCSNPSLSSSPTVQDETPGDRGDRGDGICTPTHSMQEPSPELDPDSILYTHPEDTP